MTQRTKAEHQMPQGKAYINHGERKMATEGLLCVCDIVTLELNRDGVIRGLWDARSAVAGRWPRACGSGAVTAGRWQWP